MGIGFGITQNDCFFLKHVSCTHVRQGFQRQLPDGWEVRKSRHSPQCPFWGHFVRMSLVEPGTRVPKIGHLLFWGRGVPWLCPPCATPVQRGLVAAGLAVLLALHSLASSLCNCTGVQAVFGSSDVPRPVLMVGSRDCSLFPVGPPSRTPLEHPKMGGIFPTTTKVPTRHRCAKPPF